MEPVSSSYDPGTDTQLMMLAEPAEDCVMASSESNYVQVRRNYGRQPSNQLRGSQGASVHACSTGLSTGCRLMPMTAQCGAAAMCCGVTTVRVASHETSGGKVMAVWIAQRACSCIRMRNSWQSRPRHVQQCVPRNQPTPCMRCSIRSTQSPAGSAGATVWIATSFRPRPGVLVLSA